MLHEYIKNPAVFLRVSGRLARGRGSYGRMLHHRAHLLHAGCPRMTPHDHTHPTMAMSGRGLKLPSPAPACFRARTVARGDRKLR